MDVIIAYVILAIGFLLLASGIFKPKGWARLNSGHITLLRFGCLFAFLVLLLQIGSRIYSLRS